MVDFKYKTHALFDRPRKQARDRDRDCRTRLVLHRIPRRDAFNIGFFESRYIPIIRGVFLRRVIVFSLDNWWNRMNYRPFSMRTEKHDPFSCAREYIASRSGFRSERTKWIDSPCDIFFFCLLYIHCARNVIHGCNSDEKKASLIRNRNRVKLRFSISRLVTVRSGFSLRAWSCARTFRMRARLQNFAANHIASGEHRRQSLYSVKWDQERATTMMISW